MQIFINKINRLHRLEDPIVLVVVLLGNLQAFLLACRLLELLGFHCRVSALSGCKRPPVSSVSPRRHWRQRRG